MKTAKKIWITLVIVLITALGVGAAAWVIRDQLDRQRYLTENVFMADGTPYARDLEIIDLRGREVDVAYYEELHGLLPEATILWDVPFQGGRLDSQTAELTLTTLSDADVERLDYIRSLTTVHGEGCTDHDQLIALQLRRPEVRVCYRVAVGGKSYAQDTTRITVTGITDGDIQQLKYLTALEELHLVEPKAAPAAIQDLRDRGLAVTCEADVLGTKVTDGMTHLDFEDIPLASIEDLRSLAYFPDLEQVFLGKCGYDNEALAAYREEMRSQFKLVWTVQTGKLWTRTDDIFFMPVKYHVYYFHDEDTYNLRYCEDMICIDLGHMTITDISFVEHMPDLQYLILAHTTVLDIGPLASCKKLKFLELDNTAIMDYEPLLECTGLEDLNLGKTYGDEDIIAQMTWLKNLWWNGRGYSLRVKMSELLPDTHKEFNGKRTVDNGWRRLPNYYAMRDILGMDYMV